MRSRRERRLIPVRGYRGVYYDKKLGVYHGICSFMGRKYSVGYYDSVAETYEVLMMAARCSTLAEAHAFARSRQSLARASTPLGMLRVNAGYTQSQIAKLLHLHRTSICSWEYGNTGITPEHARMLAELYGVTVAEIVAAIEEGFTGYSG